MARVVGRQNRSNKVNRRVYYECAECGPGTHKVCLCCGGKCVTRVSITVKSSKRMPYGK